jgi:hypothetical protein
MSGGVVVLMIKLFSIVDEVVNSRESSRLSFRTLRFVILSEARNLVLEAQDKLREKSWFTVG